MNSKSNQGKPTPTIFQDQEDEKKRKYLQRILDVEMGSFTPLVLGTNGGMGTECQRFLKELALKIATKNDEPYAITMKWLRTLISFEIVKSVQLSVRGSRAPFRRDNDFIDDCELNFKNTRNAPIPLSMPYIIPLVIQYVMRNALSVYLIFTEG